MHDTVVCPVCGNENAFFRIMDEEGAHYECPGCDYEWCDDSIRPENNPDEDMDEDFDL